VYRISVLIATPRPLLTVPAVANAFGEEDACLLQQLVHHAAERVERLRLTNELEEQTMLDALCGVPAAPPSHESQGGQARTI